MLIWLANLLTLSRLPLAALFWLVVDRPAPAIAVLAAAALTDLADGRVARYARRGQPAGGGEVGAWLDPLCDKLFAIAALVAVLVRLHAPAADVAAIAARDLIMAPLVVVYRLTPLHRRVDIELRASFAGKVATAAQLVALVAIVGRAPPAAVLALALASGALGLYAAARYLVAAARAILDGGAPPRP
ncbi:MAG TPA: CDP-alcohol phosphatidyltransferase family protein [Kofleriaceae bacterium]|nr:CDP-alcohol phosphatidyltransferase family protein [Kofleriaceae bacterium]